MKTWNNDRAFLRSIAVPDNTKTYTTIPHSVCLDEVTMALEAKGYQIAEERFLSAQDGQMIAGHMRVSNGCAEICPSVYVVNSYNKTKKASIRASAMVLVCKNGMMGNSAIGAFVRKHNGNALEEFRTHIGLVIGSLETEFKRLETNMNEMKSRVVTQATINELVGDMYLNEALVNATQLEIIRKEIKYSKDFKDGSLWSFYNNCTAGFHDNHPSNYDKQHIKFHTYISDKFALTGSRGLYGAPIK